MEKAGLEEVTGKKTELMVLDPGGAHEILYPFAPRLGTLDGKVIAELASDAVKWQPHRTFPLIEEEIRKKYPKATFIPYTEFPQGLGISAEAVAAAVKAKGADACIIGNAAWGSCSTASGVAAARVEKLGIPTAVIQRRELMSATLGSLMGQGLPPEVPWVVFEYPLFLVGSDLTPLRQRMGEVIARLTSWEPQRKTTGTITREPVTVDGKDYEEAFQNVQLLFLRNTWGDGTTVTPPTRDRVDWILSGTDHNGRDLVGSNGRVMPKGGILTYEVIATCLAMAGGRPEYLPILVAVFRSIVGRDNDLLTSSMSAYPGILVNGPIARQVRLSSGFGLFGPDPVRPAGTAIGRALWFVLQNVGGLVSGAGTIAQYGEMRHSCLCFAENEGSMPVGWTSYAEEYHGRPRTASSATYFLVRGGGVRGFTHRGRGDEPSAEVEMLESFHRATSVMKATPTSGVPSDQPGNEGLLLYPALVCNNMAGAGWAKDSIKKRLAEGLYYLLDEVKGKSGILRACKEKGIDINTLPERFNLYSDPQRIRLVVAGGDHPSRAMWIPNIDVRGNEQIELPRNWKDLMMQASKDLGPPPMDY